MLLGVLFDGWLGVGSCFGASLTVIVLETEPSDSSASSFDIKMLLTTIFVEQALSPVTLTLAITKLLLGAAESAKAMLFPFAFAPLAAETELIFAQLVSWIDTTPPKPAISPFIATLRVFVAPTSIVAPETDVEPTAALTLVINIKRRREKNTKYLFFILFTLFLFFCF